MARTPKKQRLPRGTKAARLRLPKPTAKEKQLARELHALEQRLGELAHTLAPTIGFRSPGPPRYRPPSLGELRTATQDDLSRRREAYRLFLKWLTKHDRLHDLIRTASRKSIRALLASYLPPLSPAERKSISVGTTRRQDHLNKIQADYGLDAETALNRWYPAEMDRRAQAVMNRLDEGDESPPGHGLSDTRHKEIVRALHRNRTKRTPGER